MISLIIIILIVNYKWKLKLFVFCDSTYGFLEKTLFLFYCFTTIDEDGLRYVRFI